MSGIASVGAHPPSLAESSTLNFADGAISLSAALVVSVLAARTLGPAGFGVYALVMAIVAFTYVLAQLGVPSTVRRYVAELDGRGQRDLVGAVAARGLRMGLANAVVASILLAVSAMPLAALFHQRMLRLYLPLGAAMLAPMLGVGVLRSLLGGLQQYQYLVRLNLLVSPLWLIGCAVALRAGAGAAGVIVVTLAAEVINFLALGRRARRLIGVRWVRKLPDDLRSRLVQYNWALAILVLLNVIIWQRSELLFLGWFSGPVQVSYYAVPFALTGRVGGLLPGAILGVLLPSLTQAQAAGDRSRFDAAFSEALRYLAILTLPICLFGLPLASMIIQVLYGPGFSPAVVVFQILLVSMIFSALGQASQSALLGVESQSRLLKTGLAAAVLSIGLDLTLIPLWGAMGAALANTTVQGVWAVAIFTPLWSRLFAFNRRAIAQTAALAIGLGVILSCLVLVRSATATLAGAGLVIVIVYGMALHRLNLIQPGPRGSLIGH